MVKKKFHIVFLCGWYPSRVLPNNGDFIQRHAEAVGILNKVSVIHIISDPSIKKNIEVSKSTINTIETHVAYVKVVKNPAKKIFLFFKAFKILLKKVGCFDVVHLNKLYPFGVFALYLKWIHKKPYIISEHWTDYQAERSNIINIKELVISKIITKNASYVCPVSYALQNAMIDLGLSGNYIPIPNVVDTDFFTFKEKTTSTFNILHVSNMNDEHKNISGILSVIKKFSKKTLNFKFILIGENSLKYHYLANQLKIPAANIEFINHTAHEDLINYFHKSSVFVLFSNYENLPCVILEAFSTGTPVISTNVGGINEYFPENYGSLIPPKNEDALLKEISQFYENKKLLESGLQMHDYVIENFDKIHICNRFNDLYKHVCK